MSKIISAVLGMSLVISHVLNAQEILSPTEITKRLTFFYQNPDSLRLKSIIYSMTGNKEVQEKLPPTAVIGFCTSILLARNVNSPVLARELKKYVPGNQLFAFILSLEKTRDTLVNWGLHNAEVNDIMWSAFFGTGNNKYLDRLISELSYLNREDSLDLLMAAHSAKWSLSSNARQHKQIGEYVWQKANNSEGDIRKTLFELLLKEPVTIRDEFVAIIKEMKNKGLLPTQESKEEDTKLNFAKGDKLSTVSFRWNNHQIAFEVEAKSIKQIESKGFFDIDGQLIQFSTVKVPGNIDLTNLNDEKEISILKRYVHYETQYFQNELKMAITDLKIDIESFNDKNFVKWGFNFTSKTDQSAIAAKKQIYYTTLCWDRVVSLNSPIMAKDNTKQINKRIEMILNSIRME